MNLHYGSCLVAMTLAAALCSCQGVGIIHTCVLLSTVHSATARTTTVCLCLMLLQVSAIWWWTDVPEREGMSLYSDVHANNKV